MKAQQKQMRILHIMNGAVLGGISTVVLNYYKHMNREKYHFDCAMTNIALGPNGIALENLGCKMYKLPLKSKHPFAYIKTLHHILWQGQYDGIHVHSNTTSFFPLVIAIFSGIKVRVAHAHAAMLPQSCMGKIKRFAGMIFMPIVATKLVACSANAGSAIFGKRIIELGKLVVLKNAINAEEFVFDQSVRAKVRLSLSIEDEFVLGCVGNLGVEKNHIYALKVLSEIKKIDEKYCMLLIGDGPLSQVLRNEARILGIEDAVHFLGRRTDINDLLNAMDAFLMPSLYEGFGLAALEASASGLPLFLSENMPKDMNFYSKCTYLSIKTDPKIWAKEIMLIGRNPEREKGVAEVKHAGYDITSNINAFEAIYE